MPQVTQYPRMPRWEYHKYAPPTAADEQENLEISPMSLEELDEPPPVDPPPQTQQNGSMF